MVGSGGFEPPKLTHLVYSQAQLSTLATAQVHALARIIVFGSRRWDSNPQPAVYKTAALPIELRRHCSEGRFNANGEYIEFDGIRASADQW
jgi:hypothetical protein